MKHLTTDPIVIAQDEGFEIVLHPVSGSFTVRPIDTDEVYTVHHSLADAKASIDKAVKAKQAEVREGSRVAIQMRDEKGWPITFRGVHAQTGNLLTDRKDYTEAIYPNVDWVQAALAQRHELRQQADKLTELVRPVMVRAYHSYHRLTANEVVERTQKVKDAIKAAEDLAFASAATNRPLVIKD